MTFCRVYGAVPWESRLGVPSDRRSVEAIMTYHIFVDGQSRPHWYREDSGPVTRALKC